MQRLLTMTTSFSKPSSFDGITNLPLRAFLPFTAAKGSTGHARNGAPGNPPGAAWPVLYTNLSVGTIPPADQAGTAALLHRTATF